MSRNEAGRDPVSADIVVASSSLQPSSPRIPRTLPTYQAGNASNNATTPAISPVEPPHYTALAECKAPPSIVAPDSNGGAAASFSGATESKESQNAADDNGQRFAKPGITPLLSVPPTTATNAVANKMPGSPLTSGTCKRNSNPEEPGADGTDDEFKRVPGSGCQSSAERNIWSTFNPIWSCFPVKKARLPKASDRAADWGGSVGRPDGMNKFLGLKKPVNRKTMGYLRRSIEERLVMGGLVISGPPGSGKSALLNSFLSDYLKEFTSTPEAFALLYRSRVLNITPEELHEPSKKLAARVRRFFSTKKDRLSDTVPRFVVVDGMERVPSKSQQVLVSMVDAAASKSVSTSGRGGTGRGVGGGRGTAGIRIMVTTRDVSKLISSLRKVVKPLKVEVVDEVDGVRIVLRILQLENVGYELLAIKAIFRKNWPDLGGCIAAAHQVFCSKQFVSEVNTLKVIAPSVLVARAEKSRHVQASDALEPLDPCSACTLRPPCQHISEKELAILGIQRRSELPQRRSPAVAAITSGKGDAVPFIDCPRFMRTGACPEFNQRRRCSHHHPFDAHIVETPKPRCPQCTIHLPCGHCDYDRARRRLGAFCGTEGARIKKHIARLRRLHHNETRLSRGNLTGGAATPAEASSPVKGSRENNGNVVGKLPPNTFATVSTLAPAPSSTWTQPETEGNASLVGTTAAAAAAAAAADADGGGGDTYFPGGKRLSHSPSGGRPVSPSPSPGTQPPTPRTSREQKTATSVTSPKAPPVTPSNTRVSTHVRGKPEPGKYRSDDIAYRKVEAIISKLGGIGRDLEAEEEWIDDPGGGAVEFRAMVFVKKLERLIVRCEEAHVEAEAVAEAFLLRFERKAEVVR